MSHMESQKTGSKLALRNPRGNFIGEFVEAATSRGNREFVNSLSEHVLIVF